MILKISLAVIAIFVIVVIIGAIVDWREKRRKAAETVRQDAEAKQNLEELIKLIETGVGKSAYDLREQLYTLGRALERNFTKEKAAELYHILAVREEYERHADPKRDGVADRRGRWMQADPYTAASAIAYAKLVAAYTSVGYEENKQRLAKQLDLPGMSPAMLLNWCVQIYDRLITEARGGSRESFLELHKLIGASRGVNLVEGYKSLHAQIEPLPYPDDWDAMAIVYWEIPKLDDFAPKPSYYDLPTGKLSKMAWDAVVAESEVDLAVVLAYCNDDDEARDELGDFLYAQVLDAREQARTLRTTNPENARQG